MAKIQPGWLLGARINRQKRKLAVRTLRRELVGKCLRAGISNTQEIRATVKKRYPDFPCSASSIRRDKAYIRQRWAEGNRCDKCGGRLAVLTDPPTG